jgi:hypothetical protein
MTFELYSLFKNSKNENFPFRMKNRRSENSKNYQNFENFAKNLNFNIVVACITFLRKNKI